MQMFALTRKTKDGKSFLCGIYTTMPKAKAAATGKMMHLDWMVKKPVKWAVDDRPHEVIYSRDGETLTIDRWEADKALINGEWVIL